MKHIISAEQFTPADVDDFFDRANYFAMQLADHDKKRALLGLHTAEVLANLFYEPSTRTRLSFDLGARQMGMIVIGTENAKIFSSAAKGEILEDTVRVIDEYQPSVIVIRHEDNDAAERAAEFSEVPIINAGGGTNEHPTQALLDLYTIQTNHGRLEALNVVIGGDLARGRTARSLAKMLALYRDNHITFVSTPELQIGDDVKSYLLDTGTSFDTTDHMYDALEHADVVYWTRIQNERSSDGAASQDFPQSQGGEFVIDETALAVLPAEAIIMHPLPRVGEVAKEVDEDPRAVYFQQAGYGKIVRMGIIDALIEQ